MSGRVILHCDCNCFYASVEQAYHPELAAVPMAVCGDPESRHGIILAKNELAKRAGVRTAETLFQAKKKCPGLVLRPPRHSEYPLWSKRVNDVYRRYTEQVESFGLDESWLDVTGSRTLFGDGRAIADRLRREVREETGLTISVGVSFTKALAKLGSDYKKPDATTVITREDLSFMVWPKPAGELLYVGPACQAVLRSLGIFTIGQIALADRGVLARHLGKLGEQIWDYANGLDDSPVASVYDVRPVKSVGSGMTFRRDLLGLADARTGLGALCGEVAYRLRKHDLLCRGVQLTIKDPGFHVITRQRGLSSPTCLARELEETALALFQSNWDLSRPVRMLTVTAQQLIPPGESAEQLDLFEPQRPQRRERQERLERTLDAIRGKYGPGAISSAGLLQNDLGISPVGEKLPPPEGK